MQTTTMPYSIGMNYGVGVNMVNGEILGNGIQPATPSSIPNAQGQRTNYIMESVTTIEDFYKEIGLDISGSGRYATFNASAKINYASKVRFNTQASFLVARCTVRNSFTQIDNPHFQGSALKQLQGNPVAFRKMYGDGFVKGLTTGGEFCAIISVISQNKDDQATASAAIKASYKGGFSSGSGGIQINSTAKSAMSRCEINISTYQVGGRGKDQSFVSSDPEAILKRMIDFPTIVMDTNAVPFEALIAAYSTVDLEGASAPTQDVSYQMTAQEKYAKHYLDLTSWRNSIEEARLHPSYFVDLPSDDQLEGLLNKIDDTRWDVKDQAEKCANSPDSCDTGKVSKQVKDIQVSMPKLQLAGKIADPIAVILPGGYSTFPNSGNAEPRGTMGKDSEVRVKLATLFLEPKLTDSARCIGIGIYSDSKKMAIAIVRGLNNAGHYISVIYSISGNPIALSLGADKYLEDEVWLKINRRDTQVDMQYSTDGLYWKSLHKIDNISDPKLGFGWTDESYKIVFTGYSTDSTPVLGKFWNFTLIP